MNNEHSVPGRTIGFVTGAFAAGLAVSLIALRWLTPAEPMWEGSVASVPSPGEEVASIKEPAAKRPIAVDNSVHLKQLPPNPFARAAPGTPRTAAQYREQPYVSPAPSTYSHGDYVGHALADAKLTVAWARQLRAWCAQRLDRDKARCAALSQTMERILAEDESEDSWSRDMEAQLQGLLDGVGSRDFSYREVSCTTAGCVIYWQTENYARPSAAGNILVEALVKRGWLARNESPGERRVAGFNPTNSIAWEALVLERASE